MRERDEERSRRFLDEIKIYYEETKDSLLDGMDEFTWNDLEMDEVFFRLNKTGCFIGEQVFYQRLHTAGKGRDFRQWERQQAYFEENAAGRKRIEGQLDRIGKNQEDYYLPMFLKNADHIEVRHAFVYRILQVVLASSFFAAMISQNIICIAVLVMTALCNLGLYALGKWKYEIYLYALGSVKDLVIFCKKVVRDQEWREVFGTEELTKAVRDLDKLSKMIGNFQLRKRGLWTGDVLEILRDYLVGVTLWDITVFNRIMKLLDGKQQELLLLYDFAGSIDMGLAVWALRKELPVYCIPEFWSETKVKAEGLSHPLLKNPVPNDFFMERGCLITGANASGKSTFMKALAINVILAETVHTCLAKRFFLPSLFVMTSLAVRDDIVSGESYYIRELRYLKRMTDAVQSGTPVFCMIDEILRGTNTKERLAASEAVLKYLNRKNVLVAAATHDMELAEKLTGQYDSYHFTGEIKEGNLYFDYKIRKGVGHSQNAIKLLGYFQFPEEIVQAAEQNYRKLCD